MRTVFVAAVMMGTAVALGAFGAHGLEARLEVAGHRDTWNTAVLYQAMHGLALFCAGVWRSLPARLPPGRAIRTAEILWTVGVVAFSGSLYVLSLGGPRWLGPITPVGGGCLLAGWIALGVGSWRGGRTD